MWKNLNKKTQDLLLYSTIGGIGFLCLVALIFSFYQPPSTRMDTRIVDIEAQKMATSAGISSVDIEGTFQTFSGKASDLLKASWPRFRGTEFDNISKEEIPLSSKWGDAGPPQLWKVELGEGHAGAAIYDGKVYFLDYDEELQGDSLRCFSFDDGQEIWRRTYKVKIKRNHGISRTIPAITDKYILSVGPKCQVLCVNTEDGSFRWGIDLVAKYNAKVPLWYTGQCPLIEQDTSGRDVAIIAPGGKNLMIGVNCETGEVLWEAPNPSKWEMSHSSIVPAVIDGTRMYVYAAIGGVAAVAADGSGKILWENQSWTSSVVSPSPVVLEDGKIFVTTGYGKGSAMFQIKKNGDEFSAEVLYTLPTSVFSCEQQTPIAWGGKLFGILPKDAGANKNQFACLDYEGNIVWTSGKTARFGLGPFILADGKFYILDDNGEMTMIKASTKNYQPLSKTQIIQGHDAWAPLAIANGRMIMRDTHTAICLNLKS